MTSIAIIGAGSSGLAAAHACQDAGHSVTLFEKSDSVGGRATTRKRQGFIYDSGAQYIKGGSPLTTALITERFYADDLINIVKPVWTFDAHNSIAEGDPAQNADPKWNYHGGLNTLAQRMAAGLTIHFNTPIARVEQLDENWHLFDERGSRIGSAERILFTLPAPQAIELIQASKLPDHLQDKIIAILTRARYNPLLSVALGYQPTPSQRPYYALVNTDKKHVISWLAWEHEKSPQRVPPHTGLLLTQMAPHYSRQHWQTSDEELVCDVAQQVTILLDEPLPAPIFTDVQRWPHALPFEKTDAHALNALTIPLGLAFCGDSFVGGRVHLALEHGMEVARLFV